MGLTVTTATGRNLLDDPRTHIQRRRTTCEMPNLETRDEGGAPSVISGYAAVFYRDGDPGTEYAFPFWNAVERIGRHAFDRALSEPHDVRALFNHNENFLLGRTSAGTLRLSVDDIGLKYEADIPDTQTGRDVAESIRRGDLTGSSFAFLITSESWESRDGEPDLVTIRDVDLFDVGPVTFPAYESSTTGLRGGSCDDIAERKRAFEERLAARKKRLEQLKG